MDFISNNRYREFNEFLINVLLQLSRALVGEKTAVVAVFLFMKL
ncbi:hypothetical protein P4597_11095 [Peribacillus simplex]|nr:hypothetical protein [Peribacillus simplex]